jgi:membrane protein
VFFLASALTFDLLLASIPFAVLIVAVLGYIVYAGDGSPDELHRLLLQLLPSAGEAPAPPLQRAEQLFTGVLESRKQLSIYALPLFLWFATRFFSGARAALNEVFDTEESRSYMAGKALDLFLVLVALFLVLANTVLTVLVAGLPFLGRFAASLSTFSVGVLLFYVVYTVAPSRRVRWDTALVAAAVAALGFEIAKVLFGLYVMNFATVDRLISNANAIALLLFVLWIYLTACLFLLGGEVADTYDLLRRQREQRAVLT